MLCSSGAGLLGYLQSEESSSKLTAGDGRQSRHNSVSRNHSARTMFSLGISMYMGSASRGPPSSDPHSVFSANQLLFNQSIDSLLIDW